MFLVFPVKNIKNNLTGMVLRTLIKSVEPRYQNQPNGFKRTENLFGIHKFQKNGKRFVILVEGPSDVVKMHQNSFKSTMGVFGSSMHKKQISLLRRLGNDIFILMDNEDSGREATIRIGDQLSDFNVFVPDYGLYKSKDPGEAGFEEISNILNNPVPYWVAKLDGVFSGDSKPKFRFRK
jgi:DNA primase